MSKLFGSVSVSQKNDCLKRPNVIAGTCESWELVLGVNGEAISKELLGPPKELNPVTDQPSLICSMVGVTAILRQQSGINRITADSVYPEMVDLTRYNRIRTLDANFRGISTSGPIRLPAT